MRVTAARSRAARAGLTVSACVPQRRGDRSDWSGSRGAVRAGRERAARSRTGSATKPLQQHNNYIEHDRNRLMCFQQRLSAFSRRQLRRGKSQSPVA